MNDTANVARHLRNAAETNPDFCAVRVPKKLNDTGGDIRYTEKTFAELDRESDAAAEIFSRQKIGNGTRVLLMAKPGLDLILSMFALLKLGAVPIAIDPGMGVKSFLNCVKNSRPDALVGIPKALFLSRIFFGKFASVKTRVAISTKKFERETGAIAQSFFEKKRPLENVTGDAQAAILFTSGSTGAPKGACYTHGMLDAQLEFVRETYGIQAGEVDLPMLAVFALFNPALGTTTVTPEMDPSHPADVNPQKIVQAIKQNGVTYSFGSPALWTKIARFCGEKNDTLPGIRRVLIAGAPVHPRLLLALKKILPNAEIHTPYGATEILPVSSISATEILNDTWEKTTQGNGTCVGKPLRGVEVAIIPISEKPIPELSETEKLPAGAIGEIIANSASCTREYDNNPAATALAKIHDGEKIWHRMGDLGMLDDTGRLWFFGRKTERVQTETGAMFTECCEAVFNTHPKVFRTALIGLGAAGRQTPAIVVEPFPGDFPKNDTARKQFENELRELAGNNPKTQKIAQFFFEKKFPVDVRHNAKIHRLDLKKKYEKK